MTSPPFPQGPLTWEAQHPFMSQSLLWPGSPLPLPECLFLLGNSGVLLKACINDWVIPCGCQEVWGTSELTIVNCISRPMLEVPAVGPNSNKGFAHASEVMVIFYPSFFIKTQSLLPLKTGGWSWRLRWAGGGRGRGRWWIKIRGRKKKKGFSISLMDLLFHMRL